jgi:hypothetical protein
VYTTGDRTLLVQGWKLTDEKARSIMEIPSHEDVVEIPIRMVPYIVMALLRIHEQATGEDRFKREEEARDPEVPRIGPAGIAA